MSAPLHPLEKRFLKALLSAKEGEAMEVGSSAGLTPDQVRRVVEWLREKGIIEVKEQVDRVYRLGPAGLDAIERGLPEERLATAVRERGSAAVSSLAGMFSEEELQAALGRAIRNGWVVRKGGELYPGKAPDGTARALLLRLKDGVRGSDLSDAELQVLKDLLRRPGYVVEQEAKREIVKLSDKASISPEQLQEENEATALTQEMIATGRWREVKLSRLDLSAPAPPAFPVRVHPLTELIRMLREIMISLGFDEVEGPAIRSSFWNFDVLFTPQDHPAREMHDTFYIEGLKIDEKDRELVERVKATHENGWETGSTGWGYRWDQELARLALLRTHTTTITAEALYRGGVERTFTIGRVYRNEKPDFKHLVELHQLDAVVVDRDASISRLMGYLTLFYSKLGFTQVKFWPTFFPYTEPSMQSMIYSEKLRDWVELCGMGIFRPEVTLPLGVKEPVMAWGMGIERLAMLIYDVDDIRELYRGRLSFLRERKGLRSSLERL